MSTPDWIALGAAPVPPVVSSMDRLFDQLLAAAAASIDTGVFSTAYTQLRVVGRYRSDSAGAATEMLATLNNDAGANYDSEQLYASGSAAGATEGLGQVSGHFGVCPTASAPAGRFGSFVCDVPGYADANTNTNLIVTCADAWGTTTTNVRPSIWAICYRPTGALSRIKIAAAAGNLVAGSRLTVYGIV